MKPSKTGRFFLWPPFGKGGGECNEPEGLNPPVAPLLSPLPKGDYFSLSSWAEAKGPGKCDINGFFTAFRMTGEIHRMIKFMC